MILMRDVRAAGADLKQGAWLHLACGVWTPEVYFERAAELQGPRLDNLTTERVELRCGICKQVRRGCSQPPRKRWNAIHTLMQNLRHNLMISKQGPAAP